ncbi:MAG TPA: Uma2 family endonuclease [Bryobacteraceae bacterium]|nr:Uma2 family endonuclease [Bryobacteraceae bacterium]
MDFVDGMLVRRNVGTPFHGLLQVIVGAFFREFRRSHRITAFTETRLLVDTKTNRHRIPDVMAVGSPFQKGRVVVDVPAIVVEIKSPDDTFDHIVDRCFDYQRLGVINILVMDPDNQRAWVFEHGDLRLLTGKSASLSLHDRPALDFPFGDMFAELEEGE